MMTKIYSLSESDTDRLLRLLYHGARPARVHTLICGCGAIADLRVSPCAWNGWQVLPYAKCPNCIETRRAADLIEPYPSRAQERFIEMLQQWREEG